MKDSDYELVGYKSYGLETNKTSKIVVWELKGMSDSGLGTNKHKR